MFDQDEVAMSEGEGAEETEREPEKQGLGLGLCSRGCGYAREAGSGLEVM